MTEGRTATAILAGGCFWCLEAVFLAMKGVRSVQSGYLGGHEDAPSYERVCSGDTGHAEAVRIEFDPEVVSFEDLLEVFFEIHDPTQVGGQGKRLGDLAVQSIVIEGDPCMLIIARDITEREQMQARLHQAATVFESTAEGVLITDTRQNISAVNRAFTEITGYSEVEALGHTPRLLASGLHDSAFYAAMWHQLTAQADHALDRRVHFRRRCDLRGAHDFAHLEHIDAKRLPTPCF